ncbi:hypothetical protein D3C87_1017820 [compost metagenome]
MLRIAGGADAARRFVQHEIACRFAALQDFVIDFDTAEFQHFAVRIADDFSVNPHALFHQQQTNLLTVVAGQVAEETVDTHVQSSINEGPRILRDRPLGRLQLRLDLRATRAQAGLVAQFWRQRFKHGRVDADAIAPAFAVGGARVGQAAVVAGAAGRAMIGFNVGIRHKSSEAFPRRCGCGRFVWLGTSHDRPATAGCARCHRVAGWWRRCSPSD